MIAPGLIFLFQSIIPKEQWQILKKVSIKFHDVTLLKWISFGNKNIYRRYYLKIIYKDQLEKKIPISKQTKDQLKQNIRAYNDFLKSNIK